MLKKFLFTVMIFVISMQCVFAEETQKPKAYDNPAGEIEYHDVCLYVKRPVDSPLSYYHYPVLDGETAEVPDGSVIKLNLSKFDIINSVSIRIMDEKENVYYSSEFSSLSSSIINIDGGVFTGKAVLEMGIEYKDGVKEKYTYHLNKTVSYRDIKPEKLIISKSADGGLYLTFELDGILNVRTSEVKYISIEDSAGRECFREDMFDYETPIVDGRVGLHFQPQDLERTYRLKIPQGIFLFTDGLNNEYTGTFENETEYVTEENYLVSMDPPDSTIKYLDGETETAEICFIINKDFDVVASKKIYLDREEVKYNIEPENDGIKISFSAELEAGRTYSIYFDDGLIQATNGEKNQKSKFTFKTVNVKEISLPEDAVFIDVSQNNWAHEDIVKLVMKGIIAGYGDKTFRPDNGVTRAELARMTAAAFEIEENNSPYTDVQGHWAEPFIGGAGEFIPVSGDRFEPDAYATRQDVAVTLVKIYEQQKGESRRETAKEFFDKDMIDPEYIELITRAVEAGIIYGYEDGTFRPNLAVTRAETAVMINRILD